VNFWTLKKSHAPSPSILIYDGSAAARSERNTYPNVQLRQIAPSSSDFLRCIDPLAVKTLFQTELARAGRGARGVSY
jgi:hypothetical protein